VLAARREQILNEVAAECEQLGTRALVVPTDVVDEGAVGALADRAVGTFGRIDVWVNNAGVGSFGRFDETPAGIFRDVIETDLFGVVHGARAVLPIFRRQGSGVLINSGSLVSKIPAAYASAYVVAKQGVRALGASLREELALEGARDIHVCTLMPASIDTPFFQHAADYTGRRVKPMPPVYRGRISTTPAGILDPCMVNASIPWQVPAWVWIKQDACCCRPGMPGLFRRS
jgi:short-subunit dehydrogenase